MLRQSSDRVQLTNSLKTRENKVDIIYIRGLQCRCRVGVWDWEKKVDQTLVLDIDCATDIDKAASSDKLQDTLDYKKISDRVIEYAQDNTYDLIETLIERLAEVILGEFDVPWVRIKLDKGGAVKNVKHVGVIIERGTKS